MILKYKKMKKAIHNNEEELTTLDINGHTFYLDFEQKKLRPKGIDYDLSKGIPFSVFEDHFNDETNRCEIPYDKKKHEFARIDYASFSEIPENVILVGFPHLDAMNPVELLLSALAACMLKGIERVTPMLHFKINGAEIRLEAVRQDAPWKTWADLVADARKRPGALNIGATGAMGTPRIVMEEVLAAAGVKANVVTYKGDADVASAILGGHIDAAPLSGVAVPHIDAHKMRYLVMLTAQRVPRFPTLPTLKESGLDHFIDSPYGVAGPKGMDAARVAQLTAVFQKALLSPAGMKAMELLNQQPNYKDPAQYQRYAQEAFAREKQRVAWLRDQGLL